MNKAKTVYYVIDELFRRGQYDDAEFQLYLMWSWNWISTETANRFAEYFGIDF